MQDFSDAYADGVVAEPGGREAAERVTYHKRLHIRSAGSHRQNVGELDRATQICVHDTESGKELFVGPRC